MKKGNGKTIESYTRIPDSIMFSTKLSPTEKIILGYLYTYQVKIVGGELKSSGKYCLDTEVNLAERLNIPTSTFKVYIKMLIDKKLIFKKKKGAVDGKPQYKNRMVIIMVDEFNPLPTPDVPKSEPKEVTIPTKVDVPDDNSDGLDSLFDDTLPDIKDENRVRKSFNKILQLEMVENEYNNGSINTGQLVDLKEKIENNKYNYKEEIQCDLDEEINYNIMSKSF